jgi:SAM-dependent methyltransferase
VRLDPDRRHDDRRGLTLRAFLPWLFLLLAACAGRSEAPFVGSSQEVVDEMLRLAAIRPGDVLYDLGSGDGRIPIAAAKRYGIRAVGIERDPQRIAEANALAAREGVTHRVRFVQGDLFAASLDEATVVTLYLLPWMNEKLRPRLEALRPGTRIVSHQWGLGDWNPDRQVEMEGQRIYLWTVPPR